MKGNAISPADEQYSGIILAASRQSGEGLADINMEDVQELFQHEDLSAEDLIYLTNEPATSNSSIDDNVQVINEQSSANINLDGIQIAIDLFKLAELCIIESDPSIVRCGILRREVQGILLRYQELLAEKKTE